jgi:hypothetical protein
MDAAGLVGGLAGWESANNGSFQTCKSSALAKPDAPQVTSEVVCACHWLRRPSRRLGVMSRACPSTIATRIAFVFNVSTARYASFGSWETQTPFATLVHLDLSSRRSSNVSTLVYAAGLRPHLASGKGMCLA